MCDRDLFIDIVYFYSTVHEFVTRKDISTMRKKAETRYQNVNVTIQGVMELCVSQILVLKPKVTSVWRSMVAYTLSKRH